MIFTKIYYKTQNNKLLAIFQIFKTWKYYLKGDKYKVLIFINYNNF